MGFRGRVHRILLVWLFAVSASCCQAASAAPKTQDAVAAQLNAAHSGNIHLAKFRLPLKLLWTQNLVKLCYGGETYPVVPSYPIIAGGMVFVTNLCTPNANEWDGYVFAFNLQTGALVWTDVINENGQPLSSAGYLAYDNGTLFLMSYNLPLMALKPSNGKVLWSVTLGSSWYDGFPTASGGQIFLSGEEGAQSAETYAVNETNGAINWEIPNIQTNSSTPAVGDNGIYTSGYCLYTELSEQSGSLIWEYNSGEGGGGTIPVYFGGKLYIRDATGGCGNRILDAATGNSLGTFTSAPPPAFFTLNGVSYMLTLSDVDGTLHCTSLATGKDVWTTVGDGKFDSAPIVVNSWVIEGSSSGELFVFDGLTGQKKWSTNVGAAIGYSDQSSFTGGLGAGDGVLVVPATGQLSAYAPK